MNVGIRIVKWTYLCVFLVCTIHDGRAANLGNLLSMSIVGPAADFAAADDVLDEEDPSIKAERQLVKQL